MTTGRDPEGDAQLQCHLEFGVLASAACVKGRKGTGATLYEHGVSSPDLAWRWGRSDFGAACAAGWQRELQDRSLELRVVSLELELRNLVESSNLELRGDVLELKLRDEGLQEVTQR